MQGWFISKLRKHLRTVRQHLKWGAGGNRHRGLSALCPLSFSLHPAGLLSNQPGPWTHSHAQWTQTTWPIEHPTDCVISAPLNQKQTDGGHFAFSKRPGRSEETSRPPAPPLAVCLAPLALPPSLIHSHVPSLSVCPDRMGQGLTTGEFLTLLFAFP